MRETTALYIYITHIFITGSATLVCVFVYIYVGLKSPTYKYKIHPQNKVARKLFTTARLRAFE